METKKESSYEHLAHIRKAQAENRLAIFIGAGVSKCVNNEYPLWSKLIKMLKSGLSKGIQEDDFLKVAELYTLEHGKLETKNKLINSMPKRDKSYDLHKEIITLHPHYIITTNWDKLFETALEETSIVYDTIACDKDLPESSMDHKLIKMHGDFEHDNYVFTETDYLNYSKNFPLIEAYLKGILATHTLLFVGYGFNDVNLKQIMNWTQNNSQVHRPRYMLVEEDRYLEFYDKYFSCFGITLLRFQASNGRYFEETDIIDVIRYINPECKNTVGMSCEEIFLEKLQKIEEYSVAFGKNIEKTLTNCSIKVTPKGVLLVLYHNEMTYDYDFETRIQHKEFYNALVTNKCNKDIKKKIIAILKKAFIEGIALGLSHDFESYFEFDDKNDVIAVFANKLLNFDYKIEYNSEGNCGILMYLQNMICQFNSGNYLASLSSCECLIKLSLKEKKYSYYFIALYNYNTIVDYLNYSFNKDYKNKNLTKKNLTQEYYLLPLPTRLKVTFTYEFLAPQNIYSLFANVFMEYDEISKKIDLINSGGFSHSNTVSNSYYIHFNLICFILENCILMEVKKEFRETLKKYTLLAIERAKVNNLGSIMLNKIELYSAVKYFSTNELKDTSIKLYKEILSEKVNFNIKDEDKKWLIEISMANNIDSYIICNDISQSQIYLNNISNIIYLIQISELSTEYIKFVSEYFKKIIQEKNNLLQFFESINIFFAVQYNLYKDKYDFPAQEILDIIMTLLKKFVKNQCNGYELEGLKRNALHHLYPVIYDGKIKFTDEKLLSEILNKLNPIKKYNNIESDEYYIFFELIKYILLPILTISNEICKNNIVEYIKTHDNDLQINEHYINFKLNIIMFKIVEFDEDFIDISIKFFEDKIKEKSFSSVYYDSIYLVKRIIEIGIIPEIYEEKIATLLKVLEKLTSGEHFNFPNHI